jgi:two-component system, NarL family, response regulator DegU
MELHARDKAGQDVNLYLLAENRLLRDTLARLLKKRSQIKVVGVSGNSEEASESIVGSKCEMVLTDCFDEDARGNLLPYLSSQVSGIRLLLFGMDDDPEQFLKAVYLGISGYLLKEASASEIVGAVHAAARGEASCPPSLCMTLIQHVCKTNREGRKLSEQNGSLRKSLTGRQIQLIRLVAEGLTNKEIASNLNLSEFTVKNHVRRIMRQVDAQDRHEAVELVRTTLDLASI